MKPKHSIHQRVFSYAHTEPEALYRDFHISEDGYDEEQVEKSREKYGSNMLYGSRADTISYRLKRAFINPFTVILLALASISFVTDVLLASNFSRNATTVLIILSMVLISGMVRFFQEMRSKHVAKHLTKSAPFQRNRAPKRNMDGSCFLGFGCGRYGPALCRRPRSG